MNVSYNYCEQFCYYVKTEQANDRIPDENQVGLPDHLVEIPQEVLDLILGVSPGLQDSSLTTVSTGTQTDEDDLKELDKTDRDKNKDKDSGSDDGSKDDMATILARMKETIDSMNTLVNRKDD